MLEGEAVTRASLGLPEQVLLIASEELMRALGPSEGYAAKVRLFQRVERELNEPLASPRSHRTLAPSDAAKVAGGRK